jgi:hypothetical protein
MDKFAIYSQNAIVILIIIKIIKGGTAVLITIDDSDA